MTELSTVTQSIDTLRKTTMSTRTTTPACGPSTIRTNDPVYVETVDGHGIVKRINRETGLAVVSLAGDSVSPRGHREVPVSSLSLSRDAPRGLTDSDKANLKAELYS